MATVHASCGAFILPLSMSRLSHLQANDLSLAVSCQLKQQCVCVCGVQQAVTSDSDVHAVPVRLPITSKHCNMPIASPPPSCQPTSCSPSQPSAKTAKTHTHAAPCIISFNTAEQWPQLDTQGLLQQHQADVVTEQHHFEAVHHQQPSRHVQQASQLCHMQCTIPSLLPGSKTHGNMAQGRQQAVEGGRACLFICTRASCISCAWYSCATQNTRYDTPTWGKALALGGMQVCTSNHPGMTCTIGQSPLMQGLTQCLGAGRGEGRSVHYSWSLPQHMLRARPRHSI